MDDEPSFGRAAFGALAYIVFVLALTAFGVWGWPRLGPWLWSHF